jgi:hypothetical protein
MAIVHRSPNRWWVPLVAIAGVMLATANASAREIGGKGGRAVAVGITQESAPSRAGPDCPADGARSNRGFPLGTHKHRVDVPEFGRSNDPNDDGTSRDISDEQMSEDSTDDDEKHLPVAAGPQDSRWCAIMLEARSGPACTVNPSAPSCSQHPLRC